MADWGHEVDLVVMGSGAAGLSGALRAASLGLSVLIVEKSDVWGGSAAMSAGALWVPCSAAMRAAGLEDSEDDAVRYLKALTHGEINEERLRAFVTESNRMIDWLAGNSHVTFTTLEHYPDYDTDVDGARPGGRSLEPDAFDATRLGDAFRTQHQPYPGTLILGKFLMRIPEARGLLMPGLAPKLGLAKGFARYALRSRARKRCGGRDPYLTMGQALTARLRLSLIERGVPLWLNAPVRSLIVEDGKVAGVEVERDGRPVRVQARRGVLVAAGGFERNLEMRERYQRAPIGVDWTVGHVGNTGDGIRVGEAVGGALDTALMAEAWWTPAVVPPTGPSVLVIEKSLPHGVFVTRDGRRFVNEASNYNGVGIAMFDAEQHGDGAVPAWWIVDATYRKRFIMGPVGPGQMMPDKKLPAGLRPGDGWLHRADTLDDLAREIGLAPAVLRATLERFNANARRGEDPDFHRGETANDRYYSDPRVTPNPSLGPVESPPFYAVQVFPGDLGTKAGLITDGSSRVLRDDGSAIGGLYAAGNTASTVMGRSYPGAGATLAPAMLGGFLAAEALAVDHERAG